MTPSQKLNYAMINYRGFDSVHHHREIALLKAWMNDFDHGQIQIQTIAPGQKVQVQTGPLMGRTATVAEQRGQHLQLILEDIGLIIQVSVAETQIEVIS